MQKKDLMFIFEEKNPACISCEHHHCWFDDDNDRLRYTCDFGSHKSKYCNPFGKACKYYYTMPNCFKCKYLERNFPYMGDLSCSKCHDKISFNGCIDYSPLKSCSISRYFAFKYYIRSLILSHKKH